MPNTDWIKNGGLISPWSTICAGRLGYAFRTPYASSKWAVVGLTKSLAIELGPRGVRVDAVLPGAVEGQGMDQVVAARNLSGPVIRVDGKLEYL